MAIFPKTNTLPSNMVLPNLLKNDPAHVCVDEPSKIIHDPIVTFHGWIASVEQGEFRIYVNGREITEIDQFERQDVKSSLGGIYSTGWRFHCDVLSAMTSKHAICLEVRLKDRLVHRSLFKCILNVRTPPKRELTFFLHMPKTGSTSIRTLIEQHSTVLRLMSLYEEPPYIPLHRYIQFGSEAVSEYDVVFGHFKYGIHGAYSGRYRYVTVIRNPYDFIKSYYFYSIHHIKPLEDDSRNNIYDVISQSKDIHLNNFFTRVFATVPDDRAVTEEDFDQAIANIDREFEFIGLTERMNETKSFLSRHFGVELGRITVNERRPSVEADLLDPAEFRKAIRPHVEFDIALYEYVLEKFWGAGNAPSSVAVRSRRAVGSNGASADQSTDGQSNHAPDAALDLALIANGHDPMPAAASPPAPDAVDAEADAATTRAAEDQR